MAVLYTIIFVFAIVCCGCILCTGFPVKRVANHVEWDMTPEFTLAGVNITDLPISLEYCDQHYPENMSPVSDDVHNQHVQGSLPLNNWKTWVLGVAMLGMILLFLACLRKLQECCFPSLEQPSGIPNIGNTCYMNAVLQGIPNIGNTCYMNAVLQVLCWTPNFKEQLQKATEVVDRETRNQGGSVPRPDKTLLKLVDVVRDGQPVDYSLPNAILADVRRLNNRFKGHDQQDSYELFNTIISGLEKLIEERCNCGNETEKLMNSSPVSRLFGGVFFTAYTYGSCEHIETTFQRFTSIPVHIHSNTEDPGSVSKHAEGQLHHENERCFRTLETKGRGQTDLENGLTLFAEVQESSGTDYCRTCDKAGNRDSNTVTRSRRMLISLPPILVLQFNRFEMNEYGQLRKLNKILSYPQLLDVAPFCSSAVDRFDDHQTTKYRLYGVVCHSGTIQGGHYTSIVRTTQHLKTDFLTQDWQDPEKNVEKILSFWKDDDRQNVGGKYTEGAKKQRDAENKNESRPGNIQSDKWYVISDRFVKMYSNDNVLRESDAYMLMYERVHE